jgi:hypothetical protein
LSNPSCTNPGLNLGLHSEEMAINCLTNDMPKAGVCLLCLILDEIIHYEPKEMFSAVIQIDVNNMEGKVCWHNVPKCSHVTEFIMKQCTEIRCFLIDFSGVC